MTELGSFTVGDTRLGYEVHGDGPRVLVYLHGLLLDANLNRGLARRLAADGFRVVLLDLGGHGRSDKPRHAYRHRIELYAEQLLALLDHLDLEEAVVGGVSLGANVALTATAMEPERIRGMVIEMPVLERGAMSAMVTFFPVLLGLRYGGWLLRPLSRLLRRLPRTGIGPIDSFLQAASNDPRENAAVLHGIFFGSAAPPARRRRGLEVPTLVIGHNFDLLHPMSDATALTEELPESRWVRAWSVLEARTFPERISGEIGAFLSEMWRPRLAASRGA